MCCLHCRKSRVIETHKLLYLFSVLNVLYNYSFKTNDFKRNHIIWSNRVFHILENKKYFLVSFPEQSVRKFRFLNLVSLAVLFSFQSTTIFQIDFHVFESSEKFSLVIQFAKKASWYTSWACRSSEQRHTVKVASVDVWIKFAKTEWKERTGRVSQLLKIRLCKNCINLKARFLSSPLSIRRFYCKSNWMDCVFFFFFSF